MTFWDFASEHWFVALLMVWSAAGVIRFAINRPLRHMTIRKHGYPPPHCDADGDFRETSS